MQSLSDSPSAPIEKPSNKLQIRFMTNEPTALKEARNQLIRMSENHAISHATPFSKAAKHVFAQPENFELVTTALAGWYKGRIPNLIQIRRWRDPFKRELASKWPNLTDEDHYSAGPYLPVKKRLKDEVNVPANAARFFLKKGRTRSEIAEMLEVSLATVYRWLPPQKKASREQALELFEQGLSRPTIAKQLGRAVATIYRWIPKS
jgi:transposase-like protein